MPAILMWMRSEIPWHAKSDRFSTQLLTNTSGTAHTQSGISGKRVTVWGWRVVQLLSLSPRRKHKDSWFQCGGIIKAAGSKDALAAAHFYWQGSYYAYYVWTIVPEGKLITISSTAAARPPAAWPSYFLVPRQCVFFAHRKKSTFLRGASSKCCNNWFLAC